MDYFTVSIVSPPSQPKEDESAKAEEARRDRRTRENTANFKQALGGKTDQPKTPAGPASGPALPQTTNGSGRSQASAPKAGSQLRALPAAIHPGLLQPPIARPAETIAKPGCGDAVLPVTGEHEKSATDATAETAGQAPESAELKTATDPHAANTRVVSRVAGEHKRKGSGDDSPADKGAQDDSAAAARLAGASKTLAGNVPTAAPVNAAAPCLVPSELLQQVVEFATVGANADGFMEFQMGLSQQTLSGLRVRVTSFGNRRVGLNLRSNGGGDGVSEEDIAGLVDALRRKNVEVVEVTVA